MDDAWPIGDPEQEGLSSYAALVIAMARPTFNADELEEVRALAAGDVDWGAFIDAAARHKVLPLIGRHVDRYRLNRPRGDYPAFPYPVVSEVVIVEKPILIQPELWTSNVVRSHNQFLATIEREDRAVVLSIGSRP